MRLFDYPRSPNPRRTRIFLAEKGVKIPLIPVNLYQHEQLSPQFLAINPGGTVPVLETDDGTFITETLAICRYIERLHPEPAMFGTSPLAEARVLMWNGIVEHDGLPAINETLRNWSPGFRNRVFAGPREFAQHPELIQRGLQRMEQFFDRIELGLKDTPWLAGDSFSLADISLLVTVDYARWVEFDAPATRPRLARWYREVAARPSAAA